MCGLVGYISRGYQVGKPGVSDSVLDKLFQQMLIADSIRGVHSTGVLSVTPKGIDEYYKKALNAIDFIDMPVAKRLMTRLSTFLVGHNRYATTGAVNSANAHPFNHDHITLFHNGTLTNHHSLTKDNFNVDSEAIANALSNEEDVIKVLESLKGDYSLIWYDSIEGTLNFARNKNRPMFFAKVKDSGTMIFGSEKGMLEWLLDRNGIKHEEVTATKEGLLLSFPLDNTKNLRVKSFKPYENPPSYYDYSSFYESRSRSHSSGNNINNVTTIDKNNNLKVVEPYDHLLKLDSVLVKCQGWTKYSKGSKDFGFMHFRYNTDLIINVNGISKSEAGLYLGRMVRVKINSITGNIAYGTIVKNTNINYEDVNEDEKSGTYYQNFLRVCKGCAEDVIDLVNELCPSCNSIVNS